MSLIFPPRPLWERAGERGLVEDVSILGLHATVTLSLTLSHQGRGDGLDRLFP